MGLLKLNHYALGNGDIVFFVLEIHCHNMILLIKIKTEFEDLWNNTNTDIHFLLNFCHVNAI